MFSPMAEHRSSLAGKTPAWHFGGDNLIPIKLDLGIQNFPASDFAAWPNPVTLGE